ncbi:MAG: hypothetical protein Q9160_006088 [Pyrenula sp. 1 TL-2023]
MAEALGLAVGFVGLAGLFSTCVDCFKLVQVYGTRSCDYGILQTMLDNQQFHFMAWGKACGFMDPDQAKSRFDDPSSGPHNMRIEQTMERIIALLTDGESLKKKYGLKVQRAPMGSKIIEGPALSAFSKAFQNTKNFWNTSLQRKTHITGTLRWAVDDRDKFDRLIQNLKDLLSDLMKFTEDIGVPDRERLIVEYEFEMIDDEPSLEAITAASACDDDDDMLSSVASRRLSRVKAQSVANQSVNFDDSVSMALSARYAPSISTLVEEEVEGVIQEIGVMRVPLSQWRKVKTRAGIMPWLKTMVVATGSSSGIPEFGDEIQSPSRANTLSGDLDATATGRPVRVAINSHALINALRKITGYRFSSNHNVLIHPFKPLVVYENDLRHHIANMQGKLRLLEEDQPKEPAEANDLRQSELGMESKMDENPNMEIEKTRRSVQELECLLNFMDNDMSDFLQIYKQMSHQGVEKISFENLWLVFRPGAIVISPDPTSNHYDRGYQVLHTTGGRPILDVDNNTRSEGLGNSEDLDYHNHDGYAIMSSRECTDFVVDCFYLDFSGTSYGPRSQKFVISEFTGERDVISLPLYPTTHSSFAREILLRRGERSEIPIIGTRINSEVIIDHITAMQQCRSSRCVWNPSFGGGVIAKATKANSREAFETVGCSIPNCKTCTDIFNDALIDLKLRDKFLRKSQNLKAMHQKQLREDQLILLPYRVCGYSLHHRKWFPLNISLLQELSEPVDLLKNIDLPDEHKTMLLAVIRGHVQNAQRSDDRDVSDDDDVHDGEEVGVIQGTGRGVLILLHGEPGTGKTLAAEAVAVRLRKPLLPVRIADFGSVSREIEQNLILFMTLAERWGCILLMNEADAILGKRTRFDREGNNIASTFIGALDHFTGILIFKTSKIGAFDVAIKSRIHLTLYFPRLDLRAVIRLWDNNLRRLLSEKRVKCYRNDILKFAKHHYEQEGLRWNGREIRNAIMTAIVFAQQEEEETKGFSRYKEGPILEKRHFEAIARSSQGFSNSLHDNQGIEDSATRYFRNFPNIPQAPKDGSEASTNYNLPDFPSVPDDNFGSESTQPDTDDLEVQEMEIQLEIAKLNRQLKALRARYGKPP